MREDVFYRNNKMTAPLEYYISRYDSYEAFEKEFSDEFFKRRLQNRQLSLGAADEI